MDFLLYLSTFFEGLLAFASPCVLPMIPVYIFYLAGASESGAKSGPGRSGRLIYNSIGFVIGFTLLFVFLGAAATSLGRFLASHKEILRKAGGAVMVLFGLSFMGVFKLCFPRVGGKFEYKFKELRFLNSILFGAVFGIGSSTCTLPLLGSALVKAGNAEQLMEGMTLLLIYSLGFGVPLILTSVIYESMRNAFASIQKHWRIISFVSGIVLVIAGVLMFFDRFKYLGV